VRRKKGVLNVEAPNVESSLGICLNEEEDPPLDLMVDRSPP
jgi:hypothetical protein